MYIFFLIKIKYTSLLLITICVLFLTTLRIHIFIFLMENKCIKTIKNCCNLTLKKKKKKTRLKSQIYWFSGLSCNVDKKKLFCYYNKIRQCISIPQILLFISQINLVVSDIIDTYIHYTAILLCELTRNHHIYLL